MRNFHGHETDPPPIFQRFQSGEKLIDVDAFEESGLEDGWKSFENLPNFDNQRFYEHWITKSNSMPKHGGAPKAFCNKKYGYRL